jgi:hexosaminidase
MYYNLNGSNPNTGDTKYEKPFEVDLPATIKSVAYINSKVAGDASTVSIPVSYGKQASVFPQPSEKHKAHLGASLTDGITASAKSTDVNWLGYEGDNLTAVVTLGGNFKISKVTLSYLENGDNWIFAPHSVVLETSIDGINYKSAGIHDFDDNKWSMVAEKKDLAIKFNELQASYIRLIIYNRGTCPENHPGAGKKAWMFFDEITVE